MSVCWSLSVLRLLYVISRQCGLGAIFEGIRKFVVSLSTCTFHKKFIIFSLLDVELLNYFIVKKVIHVETTPIKLKLLLNLEKKEPLQTY